VSGLPQQGSSLRPLSSSLKAVTVVDGDVYGPAATPRSSRAARRGRPCVHVLALARGANRREVDEALLRRGSSITASRRASVSDGRTDELSRLHLRHFGGAATDSRARSWSRSREVKGTFPNAIVAHYHMPQQSRLLSGHCQARGHGAPTSAMSHGDAMPQLHRQRRWGVSIALAGDTRTSARVIDHAVRAVSQSCNVRWSERVVVAAHWSPMSSDAMGPRCAHAGSGAGDSRGPGPTGAEVPHRACMTTSDHQRLRDPHAAHC